MERKTKIYRLELFPAMHSHPGEGQTKCCYSCYSFGHIPQNHAMTHVCSTRGSFCVWSFWHAVWLQMGKITQLCHVLLSETWRSEVALRSCTALFKQMVWFKAWSDTLQVSTEVLESGRRWQKANVTPSLLTVRAVNRAFCMLFFHI